MATRNLARVLLAALLLVPACGAHARAAAGETTARRALAEARDAVFPALVNIGVVSRTFADGRTVRYPSAGSGVIVTPEGHVLTNYHVAGESTRITCTLADLGGGGEVLDAEVVAHDPLTDLSVLRLRRKEGTARAGEPFPHARLGDSNLLRRGDVVLAMGNPLSMSSSVTRGIVSNPRRVFTDFLGNEIRDLELADGERTGIFTRWIQHDALILPGNSGGPLVNERGEVVGINELGGGGIGFAIPSDIARRVLEQALASGGVRRGWLGISLLPVGRLPAVETGALISGVVPGSPAADAGVEAGDILLAVAGEAVEARFLEQVPPIYQRVAELAPGSAVEVVVERAGERRALTLAVAVMEPFRGPQEEFRRLGMTAQEITGPMALTRRLPTAEGLLITGLRPGYPLEGARPALAAGDILLALDGRPVNRLAELAGVLAEVAPEGIEKAGERELLVSFQRRREHLLSVVTLRRDRDQAWGGELPDAWLGVETQVLTPKLVAALGLAEGTRGFRVTEVYPWTEASRSGLEVGDVITTVAGEPLRASRLQDAQDLRRLVESLPIGETVEVGVLRDGGPRTLSVVLEEEPLAAAEAETRRQEELEFTVRDLTFLDRVENGWPREQRGVLVTEVTQGGWAHMAGLALGDLILEIEGEAVADADAFGERMAAVLERRPEVLRLFLRRGYRTHFVFIEPAWAELAAAVGVKEEGK